MAYGMVCFRSMLLFKFLRFAATPKTCQKFLLGQNLRKVRNYQDGTARGQPKFLTHSVIFVCPARVAGINDMTQRKSIFPFMLPMDKTPLGVHKY